MSFDDFDAEMDLAPTKKQVEDVANQITNDRIQAWRRENPESTWGDATVAAWLVFQPYHEKMLRRLSERSEAP